MQNGSKSWRLATSSRGLCDHTTCTPSWSLDALDPPSLSLSKHSQQSQVSDLSKTCLYLSSLLELDLGGPGRMLQGKPSSRRYILSLFTLSSVALSSKDGSIGLSIRLRRHHVAFEHVALLLRATTKLHLVKGFTSACEQPGAGSYDSACTQPTELPQLKAPNRWHLW